YDCIDRICEHTNKGAQSERSAAGRRKGHQHHAVERSRTGEDAAPGQPGKAAAAGAENIAAAAPPTGREAATASCGSGSEAAATTPGRRGAAPAGLPDRQRQAGVLVVTDPREPLRRRNLCSSLVSRRTSVRIPKFARVCGTL